MSKQNQGYVILQQYAGEKERDHIPAGWPIEGTPRRVCAEKRWAVQTLREILKSAKHEIVWIDKFNGWWTTYHTYYQFSDGEKVFYFWYIYGD